MIAKWQQQALGALEALGTRREALGLSVLYTGPRGPRA